MSVIFKFENFRSVSLLENETLDFQGIYAILLKDKSLLPAQLFSNLPPSNSGIIYIGKARTTLKDRLEQECRGKSNGTFFRSIGALLNFRPPAGSLVGKRNTKNYKFSASDTSQIITWLNKNLYFDYLRVTKNIDFIEKDLIKHFTPALNNTHNPHKSKFLIDLRELCRRIALDKHSS
jgi:hypothetical protein